MNEKTKFKFGDKVNDGFTNGIFLSNFNRYKAFIVGAFTSVHYFFKDYEPYVLVKLFSRRNIRKGWLK